MSSGSAVFEGGGLGSGGAGSQLIADVTVNPSNLQQFNIYTGLAALAPKALILNWRIPYVGIEQFELWINSLAPANIDGNWYFAAGGGPETPLGVNTIYMGAVGAGVPTLYTGWLEIDARIGAVRFYSARWGVRGTNGIERLARQSGFWFDTTSPLNSLDVRAPGGAHVVAGSQFTLYGTF